VLSWLLLLLLLPPLLLLMLMLLLLAGEEALLQLAKIGEKPDVVVSCFLRA
jgi:predicted alternative tryptophan synthase beta-subunit